jgi:hypothetical protein
VPTVDVNELASLGVVNDIPPYMLPPEAWNIGLNVRYSNRGVEALTGWQTIFDAPPVAPHFLLPIVTAAQNFWLYFSLTKAYVWDGATHADITRAVGGDYTATNTFDLNGTIFNGVPIFNNGSDVPQFRANMTAGTKFANLTNWPGNLRAAIVRSVGPYLVAVNLTEGGVALPHSVQWSHPADPGSIPSSWDITDPTKDAGRSDLPDVNSGLLREALPLSSNLILYKDNSTWVMSPSGSARFPFSFKTLFETSGIMAPRCVALTGDGTRHVVLTQDDVIWHNGSSWESILFERQRTTLFNEIDTTNYKTCFVFTLPLRDEVWICYPTAGQTQPNKALIWNYKQGQKGVISYADGITFRHAAIGNIEGASDELWSTGTDEWDEDTGPWSELSRRRVVLAGTDATKFYNMDRTNQRDGVDFTSTLQRISLSIIGRKRNGDWIEDHEVLKLYHRLWPKLQGGPINVRAGAQEVVDGPVSWGPLGSYDASAERFVELEEISGAAVGIEWSSSGVAWRLDGYKIDISILGNF